MVIDDTGSVEGIYAFIYCTKWRSGQVSRMPYGLIDSQTLKDRATQLLIKYRSGALVTQFFKYLLRERISFGLFDSFFGEQEFFYQHQMTYDRQNSQLRNLFSFCSHKRTIYSIRIYRNFYCPTKRKDIIWII